MRDMTNSRATICVAIRYIIRSTLANGNFDAEKDTSREKTHRARLENRPPDHGAARPAGPALVLAHPVGTARRAADLARAARRPGMTGEIKPPPPSGWRRRPARF